MAPQTQTGRFRPPSSHVFHDPGTAVGGTGDDAGRRIDEPHRDGPQRRPGRSVLPPVAAGVVSPSDVAAPSDDATRGDDAAASLLHAHADDLVRNLQAWAEVLDRRESELNATMARQENRERSFRLWAQTQQQQLQQLEREATRLREELKQQARRLVVCQH